MVATQIFHAPAYSYDALGRRFESISDAGNVTKRFYHAGQRVIEEYDAAGTPARQRYYVWGNYIDELLMFNDDAGDDSDYNVCHDQLYSAHALLSKADGAIVERYNYYAYGSPKIYTGDGGDGDWWNGGETTATTSAKGLVYLFTGREYEAVPTHDWQLQYSRARYYHLGLSRWLQRDPLGYVDGMSLYEYVVSSPMSHTDFMGTRTLTPQDNDAALKILDEQGINAMKSYSIALRAAGKSEGICSTGRGTGTRYYPCNQGPGFIDPSKYDPSENVVHNWDSAVVRNECEAEECRRGRQQCIAKNSLTALKCMGWDIATGSAVAAACSVGCLKAGVLGVPGYLACFASCAGIGVIVGMINYDSCVKLGQIANDNCASTFRHCIRNVFR